MTCIIPLGKCCRVTNMLETLQLRKQTTLFEWMCSVYFEDIIMIISKLVNNEPIEIYKDKIHPNNISLDDTAIFTSHYNKDEFVEIFKRRSERFIEDIKTSESIIFIREDQMNEHTSIDQVIQFKELIYKINPQCKFKLLLLSMISVENIKIELPGVHHVVHSSNNDFYKFYIERLMESDTFM